MNKSGFIGKLLRYRHSALIFLSTMTIYAVLGAAGGLTIPKLKSRDFFLNLRYKFSPLPSDLEDIVIIGIDDKSFYEYGSKWPWSRAVFADIIYKLMEYEPAYIGIDLAFVGRSDISRADDILFAGALKDAGNVVLGSYIDKEGRHILPYEGFRDVALAYGFTNKPTGADGVVRYTRLFEYDTLNNKVACYSFGYRMAVLYNGGDADETEFIGKTVVYQSASGEKKVPVRDAASGIMPLTYSAKPSDFHFISFVDVVRGSASLGSVRGKIVLIGVTGDVFYDTNLTPFGKMPGVCVIANCLLMLAGENYIYRVPAGANVAFLILLCAVTSVAVSRKKFYFWAAGFILLTATNFILAINNVWWDFFSAPLIMVSACIIGLLTNYTNLLLQNARIKKFVFTDGLTGLATRRYLIFKLQNILADAEERKRIALVLFRIDSFELVVSKIGAEKSNALIKEVGRMIAVSSRGTRSVDFVSRFGDVDFCCILRGVDKKGAIAYAGRIKRSVAAAPAPGVDASFVTLNAGIAGTEDAEKKSTGYLIKCAEAALSRAAKEGVDRLCVYSPEIDKISPDDGENGGRVADSELSYVVEELNEKYKEIAILVNRLRTTQEDVIRGDRLSSIGKMVATIHHDLNKPIGNLTTILGIIREDIMKVDLPQLSVAKKYVGSAISEINRLKDLNETIKDFYRPSDRELSRVNINHVLEEMLRMMSGLAAERNIKVEVKYAPALPSILGDSGELKQVFLNLLHNAVESMANGGELSVCTLLFGGMVEVRIADTGCGIPKENMDKIFSAFFTTKRSEKGAGLGLYASREIIKKYSGDITVKSAEGEGSTFNVCLPYTPSKPAENK